MPPLIPCSLYAKEIFQTYQLHLFAVADPKLFLLIVFLGIISIVSSLLGCLVEKNLS